MFTLSLPLFLPTTQFRSQATIATHYHKQLLREWTDEQHSGQYSVASRTTGYSSKQLKNVLPGERKKEKKRHDKSEKRGEKEKKVCA